MFTEKEKEKGSGLIDQYVLTIQIRRRMARVAVEPRPPSVFCRLHSTVKNSVKFGGADGGAEKGAGLIDR